MIYPKFFETKSAAEAAAAEWLATRRQDWSASGPVPLFQGLTKPQKARDWVAPHAISQTPDVLVEGAEWAVSGLFARDGSRSSGMGSGHWAAIWPKS